jgi:hypothetical protein
MLYPDKFLGERGQEWVWGPPLQASGRGLRGRFLVATVVFNVPTLRIYHPTASPSLSTLCFDAEASFRRYSGCFSDDKVQTSDPSPRFSRCTLHCWKLSRMLSGLTPARGCSRTRTCHPSRLHRTHPTTGLTRR